MEVSSSSSATALQCIPALLVLSKKAFSHNYFVFYVLLLHHLLGWYTTMYTIVFSFGRKLEFAMSNIFIRKFGNNTKMEFVKVILHALWPMIWQCQTTNDSYFLFLVAADLISGSRLSGFLYSAATT